MFQIRCSAESNNFKTAALFIKTPARPYRSDKEASVATGLVVAESPALQEHHPVVGVGISTYEETSLSEVVAQCHGVRGRHPRHLLSHRLRLSDGQPREKQRAS